VREQFFPKKKKERGQCQGKKAKVEGNARKKKSRRQKGEKTEWEEKKKSKKKAGSVLLSREKKGLFKDWKEKTPREHRLVGLPILQEGLDRKNLREDIKRAGGGGSGKGGTEDWHCKGFSPST